MKAEKKIIRDSLKNTACRITDQARIELKKNIQNWDVFQQKKNIALYLAMDDEVSVSFIFDEGKNCYLPRFVKESSTYEMAKVKCTEDLVLGRYGIKEPGPDCSKAEKNEIELWFIPGMAFDRKGARLGRGAGFYDRLLAGEDGLKAGLTSSDRVLEDIPVEEHDILMDFVLTDKELIKIN